MNLTLEQEEKFKFYVAEIEERMTVLSDWEKSFFLDQVQRHKEYGAGTRLSPKQWAVMDKIYAKVTE